MTSAVVGFRRAVEDLAADRAGQPMVRLRHRRERDMSTSAGRIRHGFLGETARNALADAQEAYERLDDTRTLDVHLVAAHEAVRQAVRLSATTAEPVAELDDELEADMWALPCPVCDAEGNSPCTRVAYGTSVHVDRMLAVLITAAMDNRELLAQLLKLPGTLLDVAPYAAAAGAGAFEPVRGQL
ncbi:hypothetical protein BBK82_05165 [Lentzea guizhouensis]|uniref:Uncharacterized protein n=1 Tax=Lentzea guizhouensis TaxID=1586287 RepID=A0A1B2HCW8_9PSEU|nr:hypothetical protein [Lentzea guizhouensis]ANZ35563.1 hypothetical protein BBK82_05165 [Lentzea guizhouensis]